MSWEVRGDWDGTLKELAVIVGGEGLEGNGLVLSVLLSWEGARLMGWRDDRGKQPSLTGRGRGDG